MNSSEPYLVSDGSDANLKHYRTRACTCCTRAKTKCVPGSDVFGKCQRCARLNKPCEPVPPRPRAPHKKRAPSQTNRIPKNSVAVLEAKLDGLVNMLRPHPEAGERPMSHNGTSSSSPPPESDIDPDAVAWEERLINGGTLQQRFAIAPEEMTQLQKPNLIVPKDTIRYTFPEINLGSEDPETLLSIFKREMKSFFPFILVPDHVTARELRRTQPTFFASIMAVTTRITGQQKTISNQVMKQLSERVMVCGERNMDLLLASLSFAGWSYCYFFDHLQFTSLLSIATTLIADLRLNRSSPAHDSSLYMTALLNSRGVELPAAIRTIDQHRALVCYWYLNSIVSSFFHNLEAIPWTPHLEASFEILSSSSDQCDRWAATMTKIQLLTERIGQSPWHGILSSRSDAPPALYLHSLKQQLQDLKEAFALELEDNPAVLMAYMNAEISLYKIGLSKSPALSDFQVQDFDRVEYLHSCQQAVKSFFDIFIAIPVNRTHCMSVAMVTHFTWSLGVLQLLTTFDHPDWSLDWARSTISFTDVLGQLARKYGQVKTTLGMDPHTPVGEDIFSNGARRMAWMKSIFENGGVGSSPGSQQFPHQFSADDITDLPPLGNDLVFMNDEWIRDLMGL